MRTRHILITTAVLLALLAFVQSASARVQVFDGGFEGGHPNPVWGEYSSLGYDIIWNNASSARSGSWFAYLGGTGGGEVSAVYQTVPLPSNGRAYFWLWLRIANYDPAGSDTFKITVDGNPVMTIAETDGPYYTTYQRIGISLGGYGYLDGGTHTIRLEGTDLASPATMWYVDDVSIEADAVENGGFEWDDNGDKVPDGWKIASPSGKTKRTCKVAWDGLCSVKIVGSGSTEKLTYVFKPGATGLAGDQYTLEGMFRFDNVNGADTLLKVVAVRPDGSKVVVLEAVIGGGTTGWIPGAAGFTVPIDYKKLKITFQYAGSSGKIWIDDISVAQTGGGVPAPEPQAGSLTGEQP